MEETFTLDELDPKVRKNIKTYWNRGKFCDFTINVEDGKFSVHKVVIASYSDYFKNIFEHELREASQNEITIEKTSASTMESILRFCYSSTIVLNSENVQDILIAANRFQLNEVEKLCETFMKKIIDTSNCLAIHSMACQLNLDDLKRLSFDCCLDKFQQLIEQDDFLQLDEEILINLISNCELNIDDEEKVLKAILKWISNDQSTRIDKLDNLVPHVRFVLFNSKHLLRSYLSSTYELIYESHKCRDAIEDAKDFLITQNRGYTSINLNDLDVRFKPRQPAIRKQRFYIVGGWTNTLRSTTSVEKYLPYENKWIKINSMSEPRCGVGVAILNDSLYAIAGHDGQKYLSTVERLDLKTEIWFKDVAQMSFERTSVGVVAHQNFIYAIGGQSVSKSLNIVERYNLSTNTWEKCASMSKGRVGAGVTVLGDLIYAVGGGEDKTASETVECYDTKLDTWTLVAPMTSPRKHLGCASLNGKIYAVGGRIDSNNSLNDTVIELETAECYDPETKVWKPIASMNACRSGLCLEEFEGLLYAVGGHDGDRKLKLVESYNPIEDRWTEREPMNSERLGAGMALYSKIKMFYE